MMSKTSSIVTLKKNPQKYTVNADSSQCSYSSFNNQFFTTNSSHISTSVYTHRIHYKQVSSVHKLLICDSITV